MEDSTKLLVAGAISLIASIITLVLTFFSTRNQKAKDYENDYYKKIIENRFAAYKMVEELLATLSPKVLHINPPYLIIFFVSLPYYVKQKNLDLYNQYNLNKDYLGERTKMEDESYLFKLFLANLATAMRQEVWLSNLLMSKLSELFALGVAIQSIYEQHNDADLNAKIPYRLKSLANIGQDFHDEIVKLRDEVKAIFYSDILSLHNVDSFILAKPSLTGRFKLAIRPVSGKDG
jgi:hypothetical protein